MPRTVLRVVQPITATERSVLGKFPDDIAATLLGRSRTSIIVRRKDLRIPAFVRPPISLTASQERVAARLLRDGVAPSHIARRFRKPALTVRRFADTIGWHRSWIQSERLSQRVGRITRTKIADYYRRGETNQWIARQAGVSRERIRQVIARMGFTPRGVLIAHAKVERSQRKAAAAKRARRERQIKRRQTVKQRRREMIAFLKPAKRQWAKGVTIKEIAKMYRLDPNSMAWWIFTGRTQLGWFPHRQTRRLARAS